MKVKFILRYSKTGCIGWLDYQYLPYYIKALREHRYLSPCKTKKIL